MRCFRREPMFLYRTQWFGAPPNIAFMQRYRELRCIFRPHLRVPGQDTPLAMREQTTEQWLNAVVSELLPYSDVGRIPHVQICDGLRDLPLAFTFALVGRALSVQSIRDTRLSRPYVLTTEKGNTGFRDRTPTRWRPIGKPSRPDSEHGGMKSPRDRQIGLCRPSATTTAYRVIDTKSLSVVGELPSGPDPEQFTDRSGGQDPLRRQ